MATETTAIDVEAADKAAADALVKLEADEKLKPGVAALRDWWKAHYVKVGHKRLARALLGAPLPRGV